MIKLKNKVNKSAIMRELHNEAVEIYKNAYEGEYAIEQFLYGAEKLFEKLRQTTVSSSSGVIRQERGWAGHFICANSCRFRRNTLLTYKDIRIVVSTVGLMERDGEFETIGHNRHFETMAFHSDPTDTRYYDADVSKQVYFDTEWAIAELDADDKANEMHEAVVLEITNKLLAGATFPVMES